MKTKSPSVCLLVVAAVFCSCGPRPEPTAEKLPRTVGEALTSVLQLKSVKLVNRGDGFAAGGEPNDACNRRAKTYRLLLSDTVRTFETDSCDGKKVSTETRVLSVASFETISTVLKTMKVVAEGPCGADKETLELELSNASQTQAYGDSFYSCTTKDKPLVDSTFLSDLQSALVQAK